MGKTRILHFFYFLILGIGSLLILASGFSLTSVMQILVFLMIVIIIFSKLAQGELARKFRGQAFIVGVLPVILFLYILIFSTGGLASPFLILSHFLAIGTSFVISPATAVSFIIATVFLIVGHLATDQQARIFAQSNLFPTILYFLSYISLIPFAYILAKQYKFKEEWAQILEKQIATSKTQEEILLKNITSAVFLLNPNFEVVFLNQSATRISGFGKEAVGQDFFKLFAFKDKDGRVLASYSLPLPQTLSSKVPTSIENIQMQVKDKKYLRINMKILPAIASEGTLGLILIVEDLAKEKEQTHKKESTASQALTRFLIFLADQKRLITQVKNQERLDFEKLISQNQELEHLAQDFIYALRLESGNIGYLATIVDIGELLQEIIYELQPQAQQRNIILVAKPLTETVQPTQPRFSLRIPLAKRMFPIISVIGNFSWIKDSLKRIFEIVFILSKNGDKLEIAVDRREGLGQIQITTSIRDISKELAPDLLEKFYGKLQDMPALSQTSGLEGFIAKSLIERMGGNISISSLDNSTLIFVITFGLKENDSSKSTPES